MNNESVILLHGLGRTSNCMKKLEKKLKNLNYHVYNCNYPSTKMDIASLSKEYLAKAVTKCKKENRSKIHIVCHSLGGIISRFYLQNHTLPKGSRIVMLAPPNHGSEVIDTFGKYKIFKWIMGPASLQLGTSPLSIPNSLKPIDYDIGIITGNKTIDPICSLILPKPNDGKVSIQSSKLKEMKEHIVVNTSHAFIMKNNDVISKVIRFIAEGTFSKP